MSNLNSYSEYPYKLNYLTGVAFLNWNETWDFYDDIVLGNLAQEEDKPMKKHWKTANQSFDTLADAVDCAKRYAQKHDYQEVVVYEAVSYVQTPTPEYTVTQLS